MALSLPEEKLTARQAAGHLLPTCEWPPREGAILELGPGLLHSRGGQRADVHPQELGQESQEHLRRGCSGCFSWAARLGLGAESGGRHEGLMLPEAQRRHVGGRGLGPDTAQLF